MPTPKQYASRAERQAAYRQRQEAGRRAALEAKNLPPTAPIPTLPSMARWKGLRDQAQTALQTMQDEMQAYHDERSEAWQESDKGEAFRERIDQVDIARVSVEEITFG